jgi:hypothetical protein
VPLEICCPRFAPVDLTVDVSAGPRPVRHKCLGGPSFVCGWVRPERKDDCSAGNDMGQILGRLHVASTNKRAADSRALALASTIRKLMAAGFVTRRALADELNRSGIPTVLGGSWHRTTVVRMLTRLGSITSGKSRINTGLATKQAADVRAEAFGPTIRELRKAGFVSSRAIACELNGREIPAVPTRN